MLVYLDEFQSVVKYSMVRSRYTCLSYKGKIPISGMALKFQYDKKNMTHVQILTGQ